MQKKSLKRTLSLLVCSALIAAAALCTGCSGQSTAPSDTSPVSEAATSEAAPAATEAAAQVLGDHRRHRRPLLGFLRPPRPAWMPPRSPPARQIPARHDGWNPSEEEDVFRIQTGLSARFRKPGTSHWATNPRRRETPRSAGIFFGPLFRACRAHRRGSILADPMLVCSALRRPRCTASGQAPLRPTPPGEHACEAPAAPRLPPPPTPAVLGEGATAFTFTVVDGDGNETDYEIHTDAQTVGDALTELGLIEGEDSEYGLYVKTVNGITADYDTDGHYWAFYVDGEYAQTGVDATQVTAGASYAFKVE